MMPSMSIGGATRKNVWIGRRAGVHIATEASVTDIVAQLGVTVAF
jgi:hypothetical protein